MPLILIWLQSVSLFLLWPVNLFPIYTSTYLLCLCPLFLNLFLVCYECVSIFEWYTIILLKLRHSLLFLYLLVLLFPLLRLYYLSHVIDPNSVDSVYHSTYFYPNCFCLLYLKIFVVVYFFYLSLCIFLTSLLHLRSLIPSVFATFSLSNLGKFSLNR